MLVKISNYLKQKGQGIVEYAILLAFVVGIAVALQGVGLKDAVVGVFDDVATVLAGGSVSKTNTYAAAYAKYATMPYSELIGPETSAERLAADNDAFQLIADWCMGKDETQIKNMFGNDLKDPNKNVVLHIDERSSLGYETSSYYSNGYEGQVLTDILGASIEGNKNGYLWSYSNQRYFFSDSMAYDSPNSERQVHVNVNYENGVVVGSSVYVTQKDNKPNDTTVLGAAAGNMK